MSHRRLAIALLLAAPALAGCADHSRTEERGGVVSLTLKEFRIAPQNVDARAGAITFVVRNTGILAHDLRIKKGTRTLGGTRTIAPGGTARKTMHLRQGRYRIASTLRRDESLGQYGQLIVH
jgi:hypothetical protein